ncbi:MAG: trimethylamine methyltransferase family protein [Anaerolineae bacterium]|nr:trimethylamine methyltransferase family protein [Anaerolineae bacterium]MDW8100498.1 trimethylamine methyltransferase family protein [Anaerolineae bacterium]
MWLAETVAGLVHFTTDEIERMHCAALRVLHEIGLEVANEKALDALAKEGVHITGNRAFFEPAFVERQLASIRQTWQPAPNRPSDGRLTIGVGDMCQYYHSPHTDEITLMSTAYLIEATKCVEVMRDVGIGSYVPGVPRDVPQQLQAIMEYRIGAEFLDGPPTLHTLHPPEALPYLLAMAETMGRPIVSAGMFPVSPLRLAGYEFDIAVQFADRWQRFWVTTYPAVGASAPIHPRSAWVLSIAEALGGAVTLHIVSGGKPVHFTVGMFPFDLHTLAIVGGMPECAWMFWASSQVTRFYNPAAGYSMMLGTQAKRPGLQAGMEKAMAGTFGVLTGCDDLHYAGVLSFDDIFSPEQMVADVELRDALEQLARGIPPTDPNCWIEEIREGVSGGYVSANTTLDHYRSTYWFPRILDRTTWHTFQGGYGKTARQRAREEILGRLASYAYKPPADAICEVRRIFAEAWQKLGGDPDAPYLSMLCNE